MAKRGSRLSRWWCAREIAKKRCEGDHTTLISSIIEYVLYSPPTCHIERQERGGGLDIATLLKRRLGHDQTGTTGEWQHYKKEGTLLLGKAVDCVSSYLCLYRCVCVCCSSIKQLNSSDQKEPFIHPWQLLLHATLLFFSSSLLWISIFFFASLYFSSTTSWKLFFVSLCDVVGSFSACIHTQSNRSFIPQWNSRHPCRTPAAVSAISCCPDSTAPGDGSATHFRLAIDSI